ncbi:uncharacterized protein HD556DRAFT_1437974 [Suillus plorans]|uniref:Uncharacterized protein n=1 Tax=Suillus plorans TaxID=116603 RepID=A0A9P7DTQ8_9AGAM|nr:uncharacterized protein HD556DRAFT_1437974 [Suillus plorans]KAG1802913.1 hypothetical protein HD556DRAFT_1437974 [Suillus plorans]
METLWTPLNIILLVTRGMGTLHRKECLDYQMNDCNFMQMIRMSKSLCKKYNKAVRGTADSKLVFGKLDETADPVKVWEWEAQERAAHQRCRCDPTAMDIYEVQLQKVPMRKQQEIQLLAEQEQRPGPIQQRGAATWLAEGLTIEEAQVTLQMAIRRLSAQLTDTQDIDHWRQAGLLFFGNSISNAPGDGQECSMEVDLIMLEEESDARIENQPNSYHPEKTVILLPSNLGLDTCTAIGIDDLVKDTRQEIRARGVKE